MQRYLSFFLLCIISLSGYSQISAGRSNNTTLFEAFCPAEIILENGEINRQPQANIFLKDGSLVYKHSGNIKRANMNLIASVVFGNRRFINVNNQLAEVKDTCSGNSLVCVTLIDRDAMKGEYLNNSTITSLNFGVDNLATTRLDADPSVIKYPLVANYTFVIDGKHIACHEREVKKNLPKAKKTDYERFLKTLNFNWASEAHLSELLKFLSK